MVFLALVSTPVLAQHPNYEDDIQPLFARRCFACHSAGEMRSGLNLESYAGVLKGGASGDVAVAGRAALSLLYKAVAREEGAPQMPLGLPKLPGNEIALIHDWIQNGLLETAASMPKGPVGPSLAYRGSDRNRPAGAPAMPGALPAVPLAPLTRPHPITALAASPWAPLLAAAGHERIALYNLATRARAGELAFPEGVPYVLRFSRNGEILLAGGGKPVQSGKVVLFDVRSGKRLAVLGDERDIVLAADLTADGKLAALGGPGKIVRVYSVADGKLVYQIRKHTDWITAIEFSPDGTRLATGDRAGGIFVWESATGGTVNTLAGHKDSVTSLSWRGDGQLLASGSEDGQLIVWNAMDGFPLATVAGAHQPKAAPGQYGVVPGGVLGVAFTAGGNIASVGRDNTIRLWSAGGKPLGASPSNDALLNKVACSFDGKSVAAGDYLGKVLVWDGGKLAPLP
ncbi:MAG: hypothetical protein KGN36_09775 [Acidobacteriota bacterium]|nr:hypothetical protein [Acidobacteriota bacterium]